MKKRNPIFRAQPKTRLEGEARFLSIGFVVFLVLLFVLPFVFSLIMPEISYQTDSFH